MTFRREKVLRCWQQVKSVKNVVNSSNSLPDQVMFCALIDIIFLVKTGHKLFK